MKNNSIVAKICSLAEQLERAEDKSLMQLLKDMGIRGISIEDINDYLKDNAGLVEDWLLYSMNKRTDEGWYFKKENEVTYIIGYLFRDSNRRKESKYSDAIQACATFIYNDLSDIRKTKKMRK